MFDDLKLDGAGGEVGDDFVVHLRVLLVGKRQFLLLFHYAIKSTQKRINAIRS